MFCLKFANTIFHKDVLLLGIAKSVQKTEKLERKSLTQNMRLCNEFNSDAD